MDADNRWKHGVRVEHSFVTSHGMTVRRASLISGIKSRGVRKVYFGLTGELEAC